MGMVLLYKAEAESEDFTLSNSFPYTETIVNHCSIGSASSTYSSGSFSHRPFLTAGDLAEERFYDGNGADPPIGLPESNEATCA